MTVFVSSGRLRRPATRNDCLAPLGLLLTLAIAGCGGSPDPSIPRVIVLGLDGMDHALTTRLMAEGRLPGLARLAEMGGFTSLGTSTPPLSPVAWSDFITGADAGVHGIFDFIHRDPETMLPYLSTSRVEDGQHELLRRGEAFWEVLEDQGIPTTILRIPANFPPSGTASRELSGMGTPDILGGYGTFSYYTTDRLAFLGLEISGGNVYQVEENRGGGGGIIEGQLYGPDHPLRATPQKLAVDFTLSIDPDRPAVKLAVGDEERILEQGEWSDWVPVVFDLNPDIVPTWARFFLKLPTQARFFLRQVRPHLALYVSPFNIDPMAPVFPISTPDSYAGELARETGRYFTQGMPEDTGVLVAGVLSPIEFLQQAAIAGGEILEQF
ncbi:MAG: alkaline phosphatase family protein, partial [Thermoanaerobaculia bacterium]